MNEFRHVLVRTEVVEVEKLGDGEVRFDNHQRMTGIVVRTEDAIVSNAEITDRRFMKALVTALQQIGWL